MYDAVYESNGKTFVFGIANNIIFDISNLTDIPVDVSTSQGYGQIGETVENMSVAGKTFKISGKILGDANSLKNSMLNIFAPLSAGRLTFQGKYYLDCVVKTTPAIGIKKTSPEFTMQLYAAYPYWKSVKPKSNISGGTTPSFSFPVNYAQPHKFGTFTRELYLNCFNSGNVKTDFKLTITTNTSTQNPKVVNVQTQEFIRVADTINTGESIQIYRESGILRVEKTTADGTEDIFDKLDEESTLFFLRSGDNLLRPFADSGEDQMLIQVDYADTVTGVYDGIA